MGKEQAPGLPKARKKYKSPIYAKIVQYLGSVSPDHYTPKQIASTIREKHQTVKSYCNRLHKGGEIVSTVPGFYRAKLDTDALRRISAKEDIDIRLHGIKLEGKCNPKGGGYLPVAGAKPIFTDAYRKTYQTVYEGRKTTITIHHRGKGKGLVELFCNSSKMPMSVNEFFRYDAYLHGLFPDIELMEFRVVQVGLNCDYRRLRLDGVKSLKLQTFKNAWFQIYQKAEDILRIEGHLVTDITLAEALQILSVIAKPEVRLVPAHKEFGLDDGVMFG